MAVISSIVAGLTAAGSAIASAASAAGAGITAGAAAAGSAISSAASAVGSFLGSTLFTIGGGVVTSGAAAGTVIGGTSVTVGGLLSGLAMTTSMAISLGSMYRNARASAAAQKQQIEAIKKLQENQGSVGVSKVTNGLQDNTQNKRTLSSLRVGLLPQKQDKNQITQNVYGVDSNQVTTATQNMTGLNIAMA